MRGLLAAAGADPGSVIARHAAANARASGLAARCRIIRADLREATLVGHSIGAGDSEWARIVGNRTIALTVAFMGTIGVVLALAGPWLLPPPVVLNPNQPVAPNNGGVFGIPDSPRP